MASAENHVCATGAIDPAMALNCTHEELYEPRKSAFERFKTTARGLILSIIFRFYHRKRNVSSPWFDPRTDQRVICRHPKNFREHQEILEDYTDIMLKDGPVQGVAEHPWATQLMDPSTGTVIIYVLSFGTRCDAFYLAKERAPNNPEDDHAQAEASLHRQDFVFRRDEICDASEVSRWQCAHCMGTVSTVTPGFKSIMARLFHCLTKEFKKEQLAILSAVMPQTAEPKKAAKTLKRGASSASVGSTKRRFLSHKSPVDPTAAAPQKEKK